MVYLKLTLSTVIHIDIAFANTVSTNTTQHNTTQHNTTSAQHNTTQRQHGVRLGKIRDFDSKLSALLWSPCLSSSTLTTTALHFELHHRTPSGHTSDCTLRRVPPAHTNCCATQQRTSTPHITKVLFVGLSLLITNVPSLHTKRAAVRHNNVLSVVGLY